MQNDRPVLAPLLAGLPALVPVLAMPVIGICAFSSPVLADTLQTWKVDTQQNRLEFTTDQAVQPIVQLVENPGRVVIDLPGIRWTQPKINQPQGGAIQSLRIAKFEPSVTRIVLDLAPGTTVDPSKVLVQPVNGRNWIVQLPASQKPIASSIVNLPQNISVPTAPAEPAPVFSNRVNLGRSLMDLQASLVSLRKGKYASLAPGAFVLDLDTGDYASLNGDKVFPTASVIKLPILIAFLQDVEAGKISLNETLVMSRDMVVGGSGYMQDLPVGSKFSALQTITNMMITSDNTATNMAIKRMGGIAVLNKRFQEWGLNKTRIRNWLPDLRGTNTTTTRELVKVMGMLEQGELLASQKGTAIDIMQRVKNRKLLPKGLGAGASIAHKTGDIGFLLGDSGIVYMPNGKRYLIAVLVESDYDDPVAVTYIQDVSRMVYRYLDNSGAIGLAK
jgi:beta-lactamase class A